MSNGIDFVIGGKDQAKPAMSSVEQSLSKLEAKTDSLGKATSRLTMLTGALAAAYGAVKAGLALIGGLDKINAAYDESALAVQGLETALRLQGDSVGAESPRLQQFAIDMQKLTGHSDEATLAIMKQASMLGVATADLDDMAKAAIGLGEAMGTDAASGMEMMRRAQEGNFIGLQKVLPQLKQMSTDTERLAYVSEIAAKGLQAKAEAANTVAGMGGRASEAVGDLMEMVGALLAPVRILISTGIKTLAESLQTLLVPAVEYANQVLANIGPWMDWVKEKVIAGVNAIVAAFTFFEVILTNLDQVWAMVVAQAELYMLQMTGAVMHALTVVIPEYAMWFADNFVNILRDAMVGAVTIITHGVTAVVDAFAALWEYLASGGQTDILKRLGEIAGRNYLDGFVAATEALPEIAGRQISQREKDLAKTVGEIGANLGQEFSDKFAERMVGIGGGISEEFDKEIDLKINKKVGGSIGGGTVQQTQARLLTRGPGSEMQNKLDEIIQLLKKPPKKDPPRILVDAAQRQNAMLANIEKNTAKTLQLEPVV